MESLTTSEFRNNLKRVLDRVNENHQPVAVRRGQGRAVVVMDAEDYESIVETLYLVRNPANAERLARGMEQHRKGERKEIDIEEALS